MLTIIKHPNEILTQRSEKIEKGDTEVTQTLKEMVNFVKDPVNHAAGLALPQVGINKRGFVMNTGERVIAVINPVFMKKGFIYLPKFTESCLSIEEREEFIARHKTVMMQYMDINWNRKTLTLEGYAAVVAQHEYDHLDGILFTDRVK